MLEKDNKVSNNIIRIMEEDQRHNHYDKTIFFIIQVTFQNQIVLSTTIDKKRHEIMDW